MSLDLGELALYLTVNDTSLNSGLARGEQSAKRTTGVLGSLGRYGALAFATVGTAATFLGIKTAAGNEQAMISFETMLGSAEKAGAFLKQLQQFAASTPFEFPELQRAASSLISAGIEADKVIPIMTTLGDVTSGMGTGSEGVQRATIALQQMAAAGRITGEDLNQLRDAGIPVYDLLASATGRSKEEVVKLAQAGKLGKRDLAAMMEALESGKGLERFNGLMAKQSQSLTGMWSTLKDTIGQGMAGVIEPLLPLMKQGLAGSAGVLTVAFSVLGDAATNLSAAIVTTAHVIATIVDFIQSNQTTFTIIAGVITVMLIPAFIAWGVLALQAARRNVAAWLTSKASAISSAAVQLSFLTLLGLRWMAAGVMAVAGAARQAAAWLVSKVGAIGTMALYGVAFAFMAAGWVASGVRAMAGAAVQVAAWLLSKAQVAGTMLLYGVAFAMMAAGWIRVGIQATLSALRVAAAWLIAMGPIGIAIALIAGFVILVIKHWDKIKSATKAAWDWVLAQVRKVPGLLVSFFMNFTLPGLIAKHWGTIKSTFTNSISNVVGYMRAMPGKLVSALGDLGGTLKNAGKDLIQGFIDGIGEMFGKVKGKLGDLTGKLTSWKGPESFDKIVLKQSGRWVIEGFIVGLESQYGAVQDSLGGLTSDLANGMAVDLPPTSLRAVGGDGAYAGGMPPGVHVDQHIYPQPGQSEESIGDAAFNRLIFGLT